jgi:hypothetical protein
VQSVSQSLFSTLAPNEFSQDLEFLFVARLDSLRIMKNITLVIGEHKLTVDAVLASLVPCLEVAKEKVPLLVTFIAGLSLA